MATLQEEEAPLDQAIVDELIAATPEWWESAKLEIGSPDPGNSADCRISSPDGLTDRVDATPELRGAIARLSQLFARYGHRWQRATYVARRLDDGGWTFQVDFSY